MPAGQLPDVFRRVDCARLRITPAVLVAQLEARRWQLVTATVVVTHNGPLTPRQAHRAALLTATSAGTPAALCSWTALALHGLSGWERPRTHVLVPRGRTPPSFAGLDVAVHESRRFCQVDVRHRGDLARTSVERAAVDAACWSPTVRPALGVLAACVQQRLTSATRLTAELRSAGQVRRRRVLLAALADMAGGAQALSELDFLRFCRRHRLGRPVLQTVRVDAAGRRRYLDATLLSRSGQSVHVEIDGALHLTSGSYWSDMRRANDLLLQDTPLFRFPSAVIHLDDATAVRQLRAALAR